MKSCDFLEDYLKEDFIGKIYYNDFDFAQQEPETQEYHEIIDEIHKQEKELLRIKEFKKYLENRNIKESMEAEEQFKLGFKTAVKLIIESYH